MNLCKRTILTSALLAISMAASASSVCDLVLKTPLYNSCYSYANGQSRYIWFEPKSKDMQGFGNEVKNFSTETGPEENVRHQVRALIDNGKFREGAYRQYQHQEFKQDQKIPYERRVNTDVLNGSGYFKGLMMSRDMVPLNEQENAFYMSNVQPMTPSMEKLMKEMDVQIARDTQTAESHGNSLVVYVGAGFNPGKRQYFQQKNTFGIMTGMSEPEGYFKFWYEKTKNKTLPTIVRGYLIPNTNSLGGLSMYRTSISDLERKIHFNFVLDGYEDTAQEQKVKDMSPGSETQSGHSMRVEIDPVELIKGLFK